MVTMPVPKGFYVTSPFGPRWGTIHWGTDFGNGGGSGGKPIYAIKDGRVDKAGPATGFGRWVCLDHPASVGGGYSVYGHIIPEVRVGEWVREGQRIGRIDPNRATNGGVAPHLHFEEHRYVWSPPGPNRLDPMKNVLKGAKWVGDSAPAPSGSTRVSPQGTIFGIDISGWQKDYPMSKVKADGMKFVIIRLCDGTYQDPLFKSHLADAEKNGLLVSTYWYLRAPSEGSTIAQQVDVIDRQLGGRKDLGVWIDVESVSAGEKKLLTKQDVWAAKRELESRGYYVPGIYSGAWYWENMPGGEPSMDGLGYLWVSSYGQNRKGDPRDTYAADGGDQHRGWSYPLGDKKPDILQFGSEGVVGDKYPIDVNAYRGSLDQLREIFTGKKNTTQKGPLMALSNEQQDHLLRMVTDIHHELTHRFQTRVRDQDGDLEPYRDTLVGYVLETDRKVEDMHKNMLPTIWRKLTSLLGKETK